MGASDRPVLPELFWTELADLTRHGIYDPSNAVTMMLSTWVNGEWPGWSQDLYAQCLALADAYHHATTQSPLGFDGRSESASYYDIGSRIGSWMALAQIPGAAQLPRPTTRQPPWEYLHAGTGPVNTLEVAFLSGYGTGVATQCSLNPGSSNPLKPIS